MKRGNPPAWKRWFHVLQAGSPFDAVEASKELVRSRSRNCADALVALMRRHDAPLAGELAAHTLAWMHQPRFLPAFVACLHDGQQHEKVRGQAAEAIGMLCDHSSPGGRARRKAESALLHALSDPSAVVRFWCCYALGTMRSAQAIRPLEHLRDHDPGLVPGWWYVHEEAADA